MRAPQGARTICVRSAASSPNPAEGDAALTRKTMRPDDIQPTTPIETLVKAFPGAIPYLAHQHGIHVICCGEPVWATLEQVARAKKVDADAVLGGLREHLTTRDAERSA